MILYRLAKTSRASDLTGEGAKRVGGRWNHAGIPVIYTAQNGALAILEVLQYADITDIHNFSMLVLNVPDDVEITRIPLDNLPSGWNQHPHLDVTKDIGREWIEREDTLLLQVPSAVYPDETNWLINPNHSEARLIEIISIKPFVFSDQLFKSGR